ncbi:TPA: hypothetical protein NIA45_006706 [Pseudomonas aeruginosa]|nr:hypothetical protein [Pseudomonas aeruginosa]
MSRPSISLQNIRQHNAEYPREIRVAKVVDKLLGRVKFPSHRVWVDLRFDYMLSEHSVSKVEVMPISGEAHGVVELRYQGLFLMQDFKSMIEEVVPHELAHVLHEIDAKINNFKVSKPHDTTWERFLLKLSPDATPAAKVKGEFDDRAIRLARGGIPTHCECGGPEEFAVFADSTANSAKLRKEELTCSNCKFPYVRVEEGYSIPILVQQDLDKLEKLRAIKMHHPALER